MDDTKKRTSANSTEEYSYDGGNTPPGNDKSANTEKFNHDLCDACGDGGDLLCCDNCPNAFHFECVNPPIDPNNLPEGDWYCNSCCYKLGKSKMPKLGGPLEKLFRYTLSSNPKVYTLPAALRRTEPTKKNDVKGMDFMELLSHPELSDQRYTVEEKCKPTRYKFKQSGCYVCGQDQDELLKCVLCKKQYHRYCVEPMHFGSNVWTCPDHKGSATSDRASRLREREKAVQERLVEPRPAPTVKPTTTVIATEDSQAKQDLLKWYQTYILKQHILLTQQFSETIEFADAEDGDERDSRLESAAATLRLLLEHRVSTPENINIPKGQQQKLEADRNIGDLLYHVLMNHQWPIGSSTRAKLPDATTEIINALPRHVVDLLAMQRLHQMAQQLQFCGQLAQLQPLVAEALDRSLSDVQSDIKSPSMIAMLSPLLDSFNISSQVTDSTASASSKRKRSSTTTTDSDTPRAAEVTEESETQPPPSKRTKVEAKPSDKKVSRAAKTAEASPPPPPPPPAVSASTPPAKVTTPISSPAATPSSPATPAASSEPKPTEVKVTGPDSTPSQRPTIARLVGRTIPSDPHTPRLHFQVAIKKNVASIGRSNDQVDIDLMKFTDSKTVSHRHAEIRHDPEKGTFELVSMGRNGTRVNGELIGRNNDRTKPPVSVPLRAGDKIVIGSVEMTFYPGDTIV